MHIISGGVTAPKGFQAAGIHCGIKDNFTPPQPEKKPYKPYSRKARLWAWVGIAFMVFLTIMYAYAFASGSILMY